MTQFNGRLFAGRLFAGRLFRQPAIQAPATGSPSVGGGGGRRALRKSAPAIRRDRDDDVLLFVLWK